MTALLPLTLSLALAMNPFEKNDPLIDEGTTLYQQGSYEKALEKFDQAVTQYPHDARAVYNRGLALHKLERNDEAKSALHHALELDTDGSLAAKIHYNLGNVAAASQDKKLALREYREALKKNPSDDLARHNYEVILKEIPPEQPKSDGGTDGGNDAGPPDAGRDGGSDGGQDGGVDAGRPDGGQDGGTDGGSQGDAGSDGGSDGGSSGDAGPGDGGKGDGGEGEKDQRSDAGDHHDDSQHGDGGSDAGADQQDAGAPQEAEPARLPDGGIDLSKKDAEKLLDSMKSTEKNMQLWRFRQKSSKSTPHGKDF